MSMSLSVQNALNDNDYSLTGTCQGLGVLTWLSQMTCHKKLCISCHFSLQYLLQLHHDPPTVRRSLHNRHQQQMLWLCHRVTCTPHPGITYTQSVKNTNLGPIIPTLIGISEKSFSIICITTNENQMGIPRENMQEHHNTLAQTGPNAHKKLSKIM